MEEKEYCITADLMFDLNSMVQDVKAFSEWLDVVELSSDQLGLAIGKTNQIAEAAKEMLQALTMRLNQKVSAGKEE